MGGPFSSRGARSGSSPIHDPVSPEAGARQHPAQEEPIHPKTRTESEREFREEQCLRKCVAALAVGNPQEHACFADAFLCDHPHGAIIPLPEELFKTLEKQRIGLRFAPGAIHLPVATTMADGSTHDELLVITDERILQSSAKTLKLLKMSAEFLHSRDERKKYGEGER